MDIHFQAIKSKLDEVLPLSLEEWESRITSSPDPHKTLALWIRISERYQEYTSGRAFPAPAQRQDVFRVFLAVVVSGGEEALQAVTLTALTRKEAEEARDWIFAERERETCWQGSPLVKKPRSPTARTVGPGIQILACLKARRRGLGDVP